ncbi:HEAT repeat domain-containing protein [Dactylosporangium sp. AC04546]|uniref:HEAT repeat domain-containing protein n=1 Tax=Dactylosporangium sp. AC04546 TaxID=2862460 RepID=UPI001EDF5C9E|nr:HEAT repeat domain-containing protein [Dactylosporangium sp. AC04546]WVK82603.1 HEAT repeat domain-containing protein [Dactylosporangium sp. AC04546]
MTLAGAALVALIVMLAAAFLLGALIVGGRTVRRAREARRARLARPARRLLLAIAAGDDDPARIEELVRLPDEVWLAVEPNAIALLGKVRGEAHTTLVDVFERRGAAWRARSQLKRRDPVVRAQAAEVLGNLGRRDALLPLCDLLGDPDPDVRVVAARALGRIGDVGATQPLLATLAGRRAVPAQVVATALTRLGTGAQPALLAALDDPRAAVRATAAEVLGLVGAVGATVRVESALRADPDIHVRIRAARTLGRLGTRTAVAPLLDALEPDKPGPLRAEAARALGELGAATSAQALTVLLADPDYAVAHNAARSLLRLGNAGRAALVAAEHREHVRPRHAAGGFEPDPEVVLSAAHAREALAAAELDDRRRQLTS